MTDAPPAAAVTAGNDTGVFLSSARVRFGDVDAAGIVFYPRYYEMLNTALEDWFERQVGVTFAAFHIVRRIGVPTVSMETSFAAPSLLGEDLTVALRCLRLGRSSCTLSFTISAGDAQRVAGTFTIVCMDLERRVSCPWPDDLRPRMEA